MGNRSGSRRKGVNQFRKRIDGNWCIYCGDWATTEEHFPPVCVSMHGIVVPACLQCNLIAGTNWATNFDERCEYVKDALRRKYHRVLETPDWSKEEIRELGRSMARCVKSWQEIRNAVKQRLAWNSMVYLNYIDHNDHFAQFMAQFGASLRFGRELAAEAAE